MAKITAQWLGDPTDPLGGPYQIVQDGVTFKRGEDADVSSLSKARLDKLRGNPTFKVSGDKSDAEAVEVDPDVEKDALRDRLDAAGVPYRQNAGLTKLRDQVAALGPPAPPSETTGKSGEPVKPIGDAAA